MKTWEDLTEEQQEQAVKYEIDELLKVLIGGGLNFTNEDLQARLMKAVDEAEAMHTPWFLHEIIWEDEVLKAFITKEATFWAGVALYPDDEYISGASIKWGEA